MLKLRAVPEADWQEPVEGLRVSMRPLGTSVMLEAQRIRAQLIKDDPLARPSADAEEACEDPADESAVLSRRLFLMGVSYVVAGAQLWEGLADEDGTVLAHPSPQKVLQLLEQEPAVFEHFDRGYIEQAYLLSVEKNASAPSPDTSTARGGGPIAAMPAKAGTAAATASPAP